MVLAIAGGAPYGDCRGGEVAAGAAVYEQKCAECHGPRGEGVAGVYDPPLHGDLSVDELAELIERTMPEGSAAACVGDEARRVAAYVHGKFYSLAAQQRAGLAPPARVELQRLTAVQHRNALADLIGQFSAPAPAADAGEPQPGLLASYYQSDGMNKATKQKLQRVDGQVEFDFGGESPAEGIAADQFSIVWRGSLLAPHTGAYEFRIRTANGARLYFNKPGLYGAGILRDDSSNSVGDPLVDAWVGSGDLRQRTARAFLLGGRSYPLRLEFFKYKDAAASVRLEWKPPHGAWETIPRERLSTTPAGRVFVTDAPFPADDRSFGYERGAMVSGEWLDAANAAALAAAEEVVQRVPSVAELDAGDDNAAQRAGEFAARFAAAAFRRPLTEAERQRFAACASDGSPGVDDGVRRAVLMTLMSPSFLYVESHSTAQSPSPHDVAARLAQTLWDSLPDAQLQASAERGELATRADIEGQARRMLADSRAHAKMLAFFEHWLEWDERDLGKDRAMFPDFDEAVIADLRRSIELFVEHVVWSEASDYRELLLADYLYLSPRLQAIYGHDRAGDEAATPATAGENAAAGRFARVQFDPQRHSGVLTHPYMLSALAYHNNSSPIHRGVFLTRNIVGRRLKPPPVAVAFSDANFDPHLTMREKVTRLTSDSACMSCHSIINPLGFTLESYDAVGRWRASDNDRPVDTRSTYTAGDGTAVEIDSARDVARYAVYSEAAHRAFVRKLFQHLVKQDPGAFDAGLLDRLQREFADGQYNVQDLIVRIAVESASRGLGAPQPEEGP